MRYGILVAVLLLWPLTAAADREVRLDDKRRGELLALEPLRNSGLEPAALKDRAVLVNFFASWCPPCHPEMKALTELDALYRDRGLTIVSVNVFEDFGGLSSPAKLARFLERYDPDFPVVLGRAKTRALFGQVERIPTVFIFDTDGSAVLTFIHERGAEKTHLTKAELEAGIRLALGLP